MYALCSLLSLNFHLNPASNDQLDEESLKEKKKQKLLKAGFEARARARREKEREKEEKEREEKKEEEEREEDLGGWARKLRQEQEVCWSFSTFFFFAYCHSFFSCPLGSDGEDQRPLKEKGSFDRQEERSGTGEDEEYRVVGSGRPCVQGEETERRWRWMSTAPPLPVSLLLICFFLYAEDMFGADDADWAIYRKIVRSRLSPSFYHHFFFAYSISLSF